MDDVVYKTKRVISDALESRLFDKIEVLDYGFIRVIDYMGNDSSIVQAARVSYGRGTKKASEDKALINYLVKHRHSTPLEMCEIKIHVKLPIFVARQWIRHRTANVNEYSARYSILDREFYIPDISDITSQSKSNKQGREEKSLKLEEIEQVIKILKTDAENCYTSYQKLLNIDNEGNLIDKNKQGIARELARMNLNLNYYTQWYWKIDLHNLLHFISLRADFHAQHEIQVYAKVLLEIVKDWVPYVYDAFMRHRIESITFSRDQKDVLRKICDISKITMEQSGLSQREWNELCFI